MQSLPDAVHGAPGAEVVAKTSSQQEALLELMWSLWPELPAYGRKASQFVDLLGYFALKTPQTSEKKVCIVHSTLSLNDSSWAL